MAPVLLRFEIIDRVIAVCYGFEIAV